MRLRATQSVSLQCYAMTLTASNGAEYKLTYVIVVRDLNVRFDAAIHLIIFFFNFPFEIK